TKVVAFDRLYSERREKFFANGVTPLVETIRKVSQTAERPGTWVLMAGKLEADDDDAVTADPAAAPAGTGGTRELLPLPELLEVSDHALLNVLVGRGSVVRQYQYTHENGGWSLPLACWLESQRNDPAESLDAVYERTIATPFAHNDWIRPALRRENAERRTLDFYGGQGKPFIHVPYSTLWRMWPLTAVAGLGAQQADVRSLMADVFVDWSALSDHIGPPMRASAMDLERLRELPAKLEALAEQLKDDEKLATSVANLQFALQDIEATLAPVREKAAAARALLDAERARMVAAIVSRHAAVHDAIAALDDPLARENALAAITADSAPLFEASQVAGHVASAKDMLQHNLRARPRAALERLAADLDQLALIDRQLVRINQFPLPPDDDEKRLRRMLQGKVAIIGPWTLESHDLFNTPLSNAGAGENRVYGVELHATALENLFEMLDQNATERTQRGIRPVDSRTRIVVTVVATLLACLVAIALPPIGGTGLLALLGYGWWISVQRWFIVDLWMWPFVYPVLFGALPGFLLITITRALTVDQERRLIDNLFKSYMDKRFVEMLKQDPDKLQLGGEKREITVFFSDIAGFSAVSEDLTPEQLVALLNEYLGEMTEVILRYDGTLDKYIGDAIMAFWNAPVDINDAAAKACWAAIEQRERLLVLQQGWAARGLPMVDCRMGINTGMIVHGNMGSDLKKNYTLMGDSVNLAARFEPLNKDFATNIIIGEATFRLAEHAIESRRLGRVRVKGRHQPVLFYELLGRKGDVPAATMEMVGTFHRALDAYFDGRFEVARERFTAALTLIPEDGPSRVYLALTEKCIASPPDRTTWDGVYEQLTK
ncbi:MAG: adenylate/guanylate cyclase domain-containing protein, partial [Planctomycetota bacterium]